MKRKTNSKIQKKFSLFHEDESMLSEDDPTFKKDKKYSKWTRT